MMRKNRAQGLVFGIKAGPIAVLLGCTKVQNGLVWGVKWAGFTSLCTPNAPALISEIHYLGEILSPCFFTRF